MAIKIYADGSCLGNHLHDKSKRISHTVFIVMKGNKKIMTSVESSKVKTNQQAEWQAVIEALKYAQRKLAGEKIEVFSDCKNVVNIINGKSQARAGPMKRFFEEYKRCASGLNVSVSWIPREENPAGIYIEKHKDDLRGEHNV